MCMCVHVGCWVRLGVSLDVVICAWLLWVDRMYKKELDNSIDPLGGAKVGIWANLQFSACGNGRTKCTFW